jgi:hypothetical protein
MSSLRREAQLENSGPGPSKNSLNTIVYKLTCDCGKEHLIEIGMLQYSLAARMLEKKTLSPLSKSIPGLTVRRIP